MVGEHLELGLARRDRVSVVLATYNGARFLPEQLDSLLAQTRPPDEVIVVDDGSTDGTVEILQRFHEVASHVTDVRTTLRREHLGTWVTFEEGLRRATGDVLVVCDQDDRWRPDKLEVLVDRLAARPEAFMAFSDARLVNPEGAVIGRSRWRVAGFSPRNAQLVALDPFGQLLARQAVSGCTMAVRSSLLEAMLPFPADIHPGLPPMMYDRWISLLAAAAGPVVTVPERLVDYRIHPQQQIGIPALRLRKLAPKLALQAVQFVYRQADMERRMGYHVAHLEEIEKRLDGADIATGEAMARLDAAKVHLRFRASLGRQRRTRVRAVADELRRLDGYRRFSLGVASAIADVTR